MVYVRRVSVVLALAVALATALAAPARENAPDCRPPRNIVIMIGDGLGYGQVEATNLFEFGRLGCQSYESFPVQLAMSTYPLGSGYDPERAWSDFDHVSTGATDSAAAATALATGYKTRGGCIGVVPAQSGEGDDAVTSYEAVENVLERAEKRGKATGVVTSVQFSHATPAGFVAHVPSRGDYELIARQMIEESALEVIMGCGHPEYGDDGQRRTEDPLPDDAYRYVGGAGIWGRLVAGEAGGDRDGDGAPDAWTLVDDRRAFVGLARGYAPGRVLGLARSGSTLQQERPGDPKAPPWTVPLNGNVPTLAEMVRAALNVLDDDPDGFALMIEGGAIDWAGHGNQLGRTIEEMIAFDEAVEAVTRWVSMNGGWGDTLVVVTADHETGYLTGPGSGPRAWRAPVWRPLVSYGAGRMPRVKWNKGGHTNSLVPFAANGAGASRFSARATSSDPVRGAYLDNTDVALVVFELLGD